MEPIRVAICDDLPEEREALRGLLRQSAIQTDCVLFESSEALLEAFHPGTFDLLLIDIYMNGITGVQAVQRIRALDENLPIAFATTSTEHTLESYRLSVLKYLEKPVRQKDVDDLVRLVKLHKDSTPKLTVRQGSVSQAIPLSDIVYLEQRAHHVFLFCRDGNSIRLYGKLSDLLPQMEGQPFFCPHKSYCVNLSFVCGINAEYQCYQMADGTNIPISRPSRAKAKRAYEDFLYARTRGNG